MDGLLIGVAMLVSSAAGSSAAQPSRVTTAPAAFIFDRPAVLAEPSPPVRRRPSFQSTQSTAKKSGNKTDRMIIGILVGYFAGSMVGERLASNAPGAGDSSGFSGALVGAPIGALIGGMIGWNSGK